jgi:hypothetical protein
MNRLHCHAEKNQRASNNISSNQQLKHAEKMMGRYVPLKRRLIQELHVVTFQKKAFFIVTAMKTSNLIE